MARAAFPRGFSAFSRGLIRYQVRGSTGRPASTHRFQPPSSARALRQPARLSSSAPRALVASFTHAQ